MPRAKWESYREFFAANKLPTASNDVCEFFTIRLNKAYDEYFTSEKCNEYAKVIDGKLVLKNDAGESFSKQEKKSLEDLKHFIYKQMRTIKLPDLLVEVDNTLNFTEAFMFPNQQNIRAIEDVCGIIMTIMVHGCNIGIYTMSQLVREISYEYMRKVIDCQLSDEARVSLSWVVNAISKLNISKRCRAFARKIRSISLAVLIINFFTSTEILIESAVSMYKRMNYLFDFVRWNPNFGIVIP